MSPERLIDVNCLPFPDYELYLEQYPKEDTYKFEIYSSRGCPFQCAFCATNYDFRSYNFENFQVHFNKLIDLVEKTNKKHPKIGFADQSFNQIPINKKVLSYILKKELHDRVTFSCQSRVETVAKDINLLRTMRKCGMIVGYGFETANKNLLKEMHKTENPSQYIEMIKKILNMYKNISGPYCRLNIVAGFPGETEESFNETIDFINQNAIHENIQISPSLFSNYPNVHVYKNMDYYKGKYGSKFIKEWWKSSACH